MKRKSKRRVFLKALLFLLSISGVAVGSTALDLSNPFAPDVDILSPEGKSDVTKTAEKASEVLPNTSSVEIPDFDGQSMVVQLNNNQPTFSEQDLSLSNGSWQRLSELDSLNRVGQAEAMLGKDLMPTVEREKLYVSPSGYKQKKTSDGWLYNRSHLIGHQLTGENNNLKNLFTGTEEMNQVYMVKYENDVAKYIKRTNHHVRYRITPYFVGEELVCRGIHMEAQSIEDNQISFNVFIYNCEKNYSIDYLTGNSKKEN